MFQATGRAHAKGLLGKWGSRMLDTANNLPGWSPGGADLRLESRQN